MPWSVTEDLDEFAAAAGPFLRARPAHNTVALTAIETMRSNGLKAFGPDAPLFGWWQPGGGTAAAVAAAFLHSPPFPLLLSDAPDEAATELAAGLAAAGRALPGVNANEAAAGRFAAQWHQHTGATAAVHQRTRLYRLGELVPPRPAPPGAARVAGPADRDLLVSWEGAFHSEVGSLAGPDPARLVDDRLGHGGLTLWEAGGEPVSMAGLTRPAAGMVRVGPVYTPPGLRGRGYASAATAAVSRAALDAGVTEVLLYTDLANPTSNGLYQRLGYQAVEDRVIVAFR